MFKSASVTALTNVPVTGVTNLGLAFADTSGTPGNATNNNPSGRAAFAAAAATCVITNSLVTTASKVHVQLEGGGDATLTNLLRVTIANGSFTAVGNAAATAATPFSFLVVN